MSCKFQQQQPHHLVSVRVNSNDHQVLTRPEEPGMFPEVLIETTSHFLHPPDLALVVVEYLPCKTFPKGESDLRQNTDKEFVHLVVEKGRDADVFTVVRGRQAFRIYNSQC